MSKTVSRGHFGTSAEMSRVRSVLGPKCPYTCWLRYCGDDVCCVL